MSVDPQAAEDALRELVVVVNTLGGVFLADDGEHRPLGDPDWADLGRAYLMACSVLGEEPLLGDPQPFDPRA